MKLFTEIGSSLRAARQMHDLSLRDVTHLTKIRPHLIEAMEDGIITLFPSPSYFKSFAQQYADFLEIDLSAKLDQIQTQIALRSDDLMSRSEKNYPSLRKRNETPQNERPDKKAAALALQPLVVGVLTIAFVGSVFFIFQQFDEEAQLAPPGLTSNIAENPRE